MIKTTTGTEKPSIAYLKSNVKAKTPSISIEKRMPINIFNIKNVNYLKTESKESDKSIFKNERLRNYNELKDDISELEKVGSKIKHTSKSALKNQRVFGDSNQYLKYEESLGQKTPKSKLEHQMPNSKQGNASRPSTSIKPRVEATNSSERRKRSIDRKSLMQMISKVNELKQQDQGIKSMFQKISTTGSKLETNLGTFFQLLGGIKKEFQDVKAKPKNEEAKQNMFFNNTFRKEDTEDRKEASKSNSRSKSKTKNESEMEIVQGKFEKRTRKLVKKLEEVSTWTKKSIKASKAKQQTKEAASSTRDEEDNQFKQMKPLAFSNMNVPALIKEYSKCAILNQKNVNSNNLPVPHEQLAHDAQKQAVFKEIFNLSQEQLLVEESLRYLQDQGHNLEAMFANAYDKLRIAHHPASLAGEPDAEIVACDASGVSFCSDARDGPEAGQGKNRNEYHLKFELLEYSNSFDEHDASNNR